MSDGSPGSNEAEIVSLLEESVSLLNKRIEAAADLGVEVKVDSMVLLTINRVGISVVSLDIRKVLRSGAR